MDLAEIVRRAQAGDQQAMGELYYQTSGRIYALALRLTSSPELAMDVVQDTYLSAMQNLDKLREPKAVMGWLNQIAANRCCKLQRKEGRYVLPDQGEEDSSFFDNIPDPDEKLLPETAADEGETRRLLWELIDALPQEQRECMILFYFSQCPVDQIAQVQNCSQGTVKSRLNYGRKKLKEGILALEARDGIRLHSLAPVGLLFRLTAGELPDQDALLHAWQGVLSGLGLVGAAGGGTAAAAAGEGGAAAAGSSTAAAKGAAAGAVKIKIAAAVTAGAVAVGGAAVAIHQPSVAFTDPAFEQNIRILLERPEGAIHSDDLEKLNYLVVLEDGMALNWAGQAFPEAEEGTTAVNSLEDLTQLTALTSLTYALPDGGALMDTAGENDQLRYFENYSQEGMDSDFNDLSFLEIFPNLESLSIHIRSGTDLTPVETKTTLTDLSLYTDGSDALDVSQLTELRSLRLWAARDGQLSLESERELPQLKILDLLGGLGGPPVLGFVERAPALEFLNLQLLPDTDLTPLSGLKKLRAVILGYEAAFDLTPLSSCPELEVCCIPTGCAAAVPDGLPVIEGDSADFAAAFAIRAEIRTQADKAQ